MWRKLKLAAYILAILSLSLSGLAASIFKIVDSGMPPETSSVAIDLNDQGVLLGRVAHIPDAFSFLARDGVITRIVGPTEYSAAVALNNRGDVAGNFSVVNAEGRITGGGAFLQIGSTNIILAERSTPEPVVALGLNDLGDAVGYINYRGYILTPPQLSMSTYTGGIPNGPPQEMLYVINSNRVVGGQIGGYAYRWRAFEPQSGELLPEGISVRGINSLDHLVGSGGRKLSTRQPFLWVGTNATQLGAALTSDAEALSINDQGAIVGSASARWPNFPLNPPIRLSETIAMLWTNGIGIDLNTLVELPPGTQLTSAVAINEKGEIAADLIKYDGTVRAVILQPTNVLHVPPIRITSPSNTVYTTNILHASLAPGWPAHIYEVKYTAYRRILQPAQGGGDFWQPPYWVHVPYWTNYATWPSYETTIHPLQPGQYALSATLYDSNRVEAFLPPIFFTVTAPLEMQLARMNLREIFEYGFHGGAGYQYIVEESTNLVAWTSIPSTDGTSGGAFALAPDLPRKYFRARVIRSDPEFFGTELASQYPPDLNRQTFRLYRYDNQFVYAMKFALETVEVALTELGEHSQGTYQYTMVGDRRQISIDLPELKIQIRLQIQWSVTDMLHDWEATEIRDTGTKSYTGRFFAHPVWW